MNNNNIAVARLWHKKGKYEYFGLKQLIAAFPDNNFDFHIVLDQYDYTDEWSSKIDDLNLNISYYSKQDMQSYYKVCTNTEYDLTNFIHFYHIIIGHYLRRVKLYDYMLTYEYDVIFNSNDLLDIKNCLDHHIPFGISEPQNSNCDKALIQSLCNLFQQDLTKFIQRNNFQLLGINAGFQGVNLKLFDEFLAGSGFDSMMSLFDFTGIYKEDGTEKWGWERTIFDTQEQSFYSIMNQSVSDNFKILDPTVYFFFPCWDDMEGYVEQAMQSKILHFTGHVKSKKMSELIEQSTLLCE
jgi:hypothetical protein